MNSFVEVVVRDDNFLSRGWSEAEAVEMVVEMVVVVMEEEVEEEEEREAEGGGGDG